MDANQRIRDLTTEKGWSNYRLAEAAGLSHSTIAALFQRNTVPTIATVEAVCMAFGITVAQFFTPEAEESSMPISEEQKILLRRYALLSPEQKELIQQTMAQFLQ